MHKLREMYLFGTCVYLLGNCTFSNRKFKTELKMMKCNPYINFYIVFWKMNIFTYIMFGIHLCSCIHFLVRNQNIIIEKLRILLKNQVST